MLSDGAGHWSDSAGAALPDLDGCFDLDISATPFTNSLPIRRLALDPGQSVRQTSAYIAIPEMRVRPAPERYTCLGRQGSDARYRYEWLSSGFTAELPVDADGLVIDYPELFRRVAPA